VFIKCNVNHNILTGVYFITPFNLSHYITDNNIIVFVSVDNMWITKKIIH